MTTRRGTLETRPRRDLSSVLAGDLTSRLARRGWARPAWPPVGGDGSGGVVLSLTVSLRWDDGVARVWVHEPALGPEGHSVRELPLPGLTFAALARGVAGAMGDPRTSLWWIRPSGRRVTANGVELPPPVTSDPCSM